MTVEGIHQYFPGLTEIQIRRFKQLQAIYEDWNSKINVISRKDMDAFYLHHVLHSLSIARFIEFAPQSKVLDIGTGGGFPGIPLAIFFPQVYFTLVDSISKKIKVVEAVAETIGLTNVSAVNDRVENVHGPFDFIVSRAVAPMKDLYQWTHDTLAVKDKNDIKNGYILLKGGDLNEEIAELGKPVLEKNISAYFAENFFDTKKLVYFN